MKPSRFLLFLIPLLLAACGQGETETPDLGRHGKVSVFITDDLTTQYAEVWITVYKVTAENAQGESYTLYKNDAGQVFNLAELSNESQLLAVDTLPEGTYTRFNIFVAKTVSLVTLDGATETREFATAKEVLKFKVDGSLEVTAGAATAFSLDFDLKAFVINDAGKVVPVINFVKSPGQLKKHFAKLKGVVTSVEPDHFMMAPRSGGEAITVSLHPVGIITGRGHPASIAEIETGSRVEIYGDYDADNLTITAMRIKVKNRVRNHVGAPEWHNFDYDFEVEGLVENIENDVLTIDVKKAKEIPDTDTIQIQLTDTTLFVRGGADTLAIGQYLEIEGMIDNGSYLAARIRIEGIGPHDDGDSAYTEAHATVVARADNLVTVKITHSDSSNLDTDIELVIDLNNVELRNGTADIIQTDTRLEIKGTLDDLGEFTAFVIKIEHDADEANDDNRPRVEGTISAVENGIVTVLVSKVKNVAIDVGTEINIDLATVTIAGFKPTGLATGASVELKGVLAENGEFIPQLLKRRK